MFVLVEKERKVTGASVSTSPIVIPLVSLRKPQFPSAAEHPASIYPCKEDGCDYHVRV